MLINKVYWFDVYRLNTVDTVYAENFTQGQKAKRINCCYHLSNKNSYAFGMGTNSF